MNRLTEECWRNMDPWETCGQDNYCKRGCHEQGGCTKGCVVPNMYAKLAEYEDAEEQGLLIKLPCNVGNTVYIVFNEYGELFIQEGWAVTEITITGDDILFDFECFQTEESESRNIDSFGKTVFLTRETAESALKGGSL